MIWQGLLGAFPREAKPHVHSKTCLAWFLTARGWEQPVCPWMDEQIHRCGPVVPFSHTQEGSSDTGYTVGDPETMMLSERNPSQWAMGYRILFVGNVQNRLSTEKKKKFTD